MGLKQIKWARLGLLAVMAASAVGCQNKVYDENLALHDENRALRARNTDIDSRLRQAPDGQTVQRMQSDLSARDAKIRELEEQLKTPAPGAGAADPAIGGIETTYDRTAGTMTVNLPGELLFDPGKATLKASATATLDKIAKALTHDYAGKQVRVEGHTDNDPITKTKDVWQDNLDLSLNRAAAVTRFLENKGVDAKLITTSGFGPNRPKGNKAQSRRVEIVVVVG